MPFLATKSSKKGILLFFDENQNILWTHLQPATDGQPIKTN
jgi:hypothetical protein